MSKKSVILLALLIFITGCNYPNQSPKSKYIIYEGYYKCEKCQSIQGGIYGKGPTRRFHSKKAELCYHQWDEISKEQFKRLAAKWHNVDWTKETPFWNYKQRTIEQ